uniref:Chromosome partition protein Smc n=1 Tax=candidate division WOR-3 bacterium TaxID=2052148 RepID=A0A7C4CC33_UNCW3
MYIKELQLVGFKSFQEKATLRFSAGMNAIIGPNGCGKSNVLDALRWVLGEQAFSVLRCARNEDLIFGGTATTPALNYAEVRLVLSTEDRPELGAEVEIRRRYFRSGESEYYLNRQPCRLRDITDVFLSAGIGTKAYSIFDLRQMREIISGNVRRMFEEAATLAKYRDAKEETQRKLELTADDLTRLDDIIAERERVVRTLARQAARLRAHQRLRAEEKSLRLLELKRDFDEVQRALALAQSDAATLERAEAERLEQMRRVENELRSQRGRIHEVQARKDRMVNEARERRQVLSRLEGESLLEQQRAEFLRQRATQAENERQQRVQDFEQRQRTFDEALVRMSESSRRLADAEVRLEQAQSANRAAEERLYELRRHAADSRERLSDLTAEEQRVVQELALLEAAADNSREAVARLDDELAAIAGRAAAARQAADAAAVEVVRQAAECDRSREKLERLRRELARTRTEQAGVRSRRTDLAEQKAGLEREIAVLETATASEQKRVIDEVLAGQVSGSLSRFLEIEPGWERAAAAALQPLIEFTVCTGVPDATVLKRLAQAAPELRFCLVDDRIKASGPVNAGPDTRLSAHVRVKPDAPAVLAGTVAAFAVAVDPSELVRLAAEGSETPAVTRDGMAWFGDGRLVLEGAGAGRLGAERRLSERQAAAKAVEAELERLAAVEAELDRQRATLEQQLEVGEGDRVELERARLEAAAAAAAQSATAAEQARDEARLRQERYNQAGQQRLLEEKLGQVRARLTVVREKVEAAAAALASADEQARQQEAEVKAGLARAAEILAETAGLRQEVLRLETESAYAKRTIDEVRRRVTELEAEAAAAIEEAGRLEQTVHAREGEIAAAQAQVAGLEAEAAQLSLAEVTRAEEELEENLAELRRQQEQNHSLLMDQRMRRFELERQAAAIAEEARQSYGTDIATFQPEATDDFAGRLEHVRRRLEVLGQVNPLAAEEHEQEKADLSRLVAQREDVALARSNLEQALVEIDRHAREQFLTTYSEVRTQFQQVFKELFIEGEADLVLVNDANPLESEIAIVARPRGKTPKRLEQLSDGEKAMLAVSLLFAFYRVKPAPFCFLDEVDAPLDDINVGRFADYLKSIASRTQVIIITHNRATVERADVLFGVTAEQPGVSKLISVSLAEYREQRATEPETGG